MRKFMMLAAMVAALFVGRVDADLVAYWNFNSNDLPGGGFGYLADPDVFPLAADQGMGSLTFGDGILSDTVVNGNGDTVYQWIQSFGGSADNALGGDVSGGTLSLQGGTDSQNNGGYLQFAFDMTGLMDLVVSYDTRGTSSGFTTHIWSWSTDGASFTDFDTLTDRNVTTFSTLTLDPLNALNNVSTAFLRLRVDGATGTTGNNRFDNVQLNASAIPEPTSGMVLVGLAGLVAINRRRR